MPEAVKTLSSDRNRGTVIRALPVTGQKVVIPSSIQNCPFEGGKQIDPYLLAAAEVQELQHRIETMLEKEKELKRQILSLREELKQGEIRFERKEKELRENIRLEGIQMHRKESEKGFREGYAEGMATAEKEIEEKVQNQYEEHFSETVALVQQALNGLKEAIDRDIENNAPKMVRLWQIMLQRLLRCKVELDEQAAIRVFRELLTRVSDRGKIKLFINPSDRDLFLSRSEEMAEIKRVAELFEIIGDENIEKGSCILETNLGVHDARWSSQLEAMNGQIDRLVREI